MNEFEMSDALKQLPRVSASPRFTSEVMERLQGRRRSPVLRYALALATTFCLVLAIVHSASVRAGEQRRSELRAEQQRLATELERVKARAENPQPVVVLENDETRLILHVADRSRATTASQIIY